MLIRIAIALVMCSVSGCTKIAFNPQTHEVTYSSVLSDKKFNTMEITLPDGSKIKIGGYQSESAEVVEAALTTTFKAVKAGAVVVP